MAENMHGPSYHRTLLGGIRARFKARGLLRADEFETMVRQARSSLGGKRAAQKKHDPTQGGTVTGCSIITTTNTANLPSHVVQVFTAPPTVPSAGATLGQLGPLDDGDGDEEYPCASCAGGDPANCSCPACTGEDGVDNDGDEGILEPTASDCWCLAAIGDRGQSSRMSEPSPLRTSSGTPCRLFLEQPLLGLPARIHVLPKPGNYQHSIYGDLNITASRIADMVSKFNQGVYQRDSSGRPAVPIDAEHDTKLSGAMAWLSALHLNEDGSADGDVTWTDRGRAAMAGDRYRYFSPEWFDEWKDSNTGTMIPNVLIGGALTTRPYFKTNAGGEALRPLVASELGLTFMEGDVQTLFGGTTSMPDTTIQLTEEQKSFTEMQRKMSELAAANETLAEQAKSFMEIANKSKEEAKQANERATALELENRRKTFAERAREWVGAPVTEFVSFMEGLDATQREQFGTWQDAHASQLRESGLFKEAGAPGTVGQADNPQAQLDALTRKRMSEKSLSFRDAAREVMSENSGLMQRAKTSTEINSSRSGGDVD